LSPVAASGPNTTQPSPLEGDSASVTVSSPLEGGPPQRKRRIRLGLSLFWRTFFLLALLLVGSTIAWLQTFASSSTSRAPSRRRTRSLRWST
jgi:two-component system osmolarity sensor histidine kinase EnvZ